MKESPSPQAFPQQWPFLSLFTSLHLVLTSQEDCSIDSLKGSLSVLMVKLTGSQSWEWEGKEPVASLSHNDNGGLIGTIGSTWCSEAREALCSRKDRTRLTQLTQHSGATLHTSLQQCPTQTTTAMVLKDLDLLENLFKKHDLRYIPQKLKGNSSLLLGSLPSTSHLQRTFLYHPEDGCRGRPPSLPTLTCLSDTFADAVSRHTPA